MLYYHWTPPACPSCYACGHDFTINQCISCPRVAYSLRYNKFYDLTATMRSEVCNHVSFKPHLKPVSDETLNFPSTNSDSNTQFDVTANSLKEMYL